MFDGDKRKHRQSVLPFASSSAKTAGARRQNICGRAKSKSLRQTSLNFGQKQHTCKE
ncbi:MAG: hypothetical protein SGCHY_001656, partial [Lobulomycetales sp.]